MLTTTIYQTIDQLKLRLSAVNASILALEAIADKKPKELRGRKSMPLEERERVRQRMIELWRKKREAAL